MKSVKLKAGELTGRGDYGRGIARLSSKAMDEIGVKEGDVFEINRKTAVVAVRAYPADVGDNIIRIDGLVRRNAGVSIGEILSLRKAEVKNAKKLVLAPVEKNILFYITPNLVKQDIYMRPFTKGDMFVANPVFKRKGEEDYGSVFEHFFGSDFSGTFIGGGETRLKVVKTSPKGTIQVTDATEIEIQPCSQDISEDFLFKSKSKMPVPLFVTMEWKGEKQRFKRISKSFSRDSVNEYLAKNKKKRDELFCFHLNEKWWIFRRL